VRSLERRLAALEKQHDRSEAPQAWAAVHAASQRCTARVRLKVCHLLTVEATDPRVIEAAALLVDETPERMAQDEETITHWRRQQAFPWDAGAVRERMTERLDAITRRVGQEIQ
jgi:hypothetical protein